MYVYIQFYDIETLIVIIWKKKIYLAKLTIMGNVI